jgi:nicotinate phosphoribosyltransferase
MIVESLLENDLYKFTMWQALLHSNPGAQAEYEYVCRNKTEYPLANLKSQVEKELDHLCTLRFQADELEYLRGLRFIKSDFVDFLELFHFQRKFITVGTDGEHLTIKAKGPLIHVMGFEIFVLSIVSELYNQEVSQDPMTSAIIGNERLGKKIELLKNLQASPSASLRNNPFEIFDFGLRRRFSREWQNHVVSQFARKVPEYFKGTSNVYLAKKHNLVPIGTMAHEYLQAYQGFGYRLRDFQKCALEGWVQEYRGDLGTALTDVVGMDAFIGDFDLYFAKLFDGLRHDSGDPYEWAEKALTHYKNLKIDPRTKRLTFSDGLDIPKALDLWKEFGDQIQMGFGIGTNLTNDLGVQPLNIVMKMVSCNGQPVAKLSDSPGKTLCKDETYLAYLSQVFNVKRV